MLIPVVLRKKRDDWTTHKLSRNVGVEVTPSENLATVPRANDLMVARSVGCVALLASTSSGFLRTKVATNPGVLRL